MELTEIQNLQVGSFAEGGLTFEQRKRLSIACELAGSPSVVFLDGKEKDCRNVFRSCSRITQLSSSSFRIQEPTSGLDSRGAIVVMRAMKRIAGTREFCFACRTITISQLLTRTVFPDTGRTVCATIHQPSSAVFEMFDDLLLLKKGGNVVFFGELGRESVNLIDYFESKGANPIKYGENPAAWMLTCYSGEHAETSLLDWGAVYRQSKQYEEAQKGIAAIHAATNESKKIVFDEVYVTTFYQRLWLMIKRLYRIYKRSPAYNLARLMIAIFYSFIIGSVFFQQNGRRDIWTENELSVCC
jgi:energy-coupling factor transporter ATP-binding protein EcfA2